ncbi:ABC transporter substrate-binding protein [Nocardiopsis sediminis]|uniref:ABC transporter substrate-binding protein n=1 Tax=Nocardiopsis sediminis TaxID=1778267 RepID=A0ABV8FPD7_9ACTN
MGLIQPPVRRISVRKLIAAAAVVLLAAGAVLYAVPHLRCGNIWADIRVLGDDGECVGTTDGSHVFDPDFTDIQARIAAENERVAGEVEGGADAVRVALLTQLTPTQESAMSPDQVLSSLEGAYVAQWRANHSRAIGDRTPLVQLVLANEGSRQEHWEPVVDRLVEMASEEPVPLLAVVGLGVSVQSTSDAAGRLSDNGIPMVSAVASADGLNDSARRGLVRVSPSNTDFVTALRGYTEAHDELETGILVYDQNAPDLFVSTLTDAFEAQMADFTQGIPPQPFSGTALDESPTPTLFASAAQNICQTEADMVFYAGRGVDLAGLVEALHTRSCVREPLTVFFAETGLSLREDEQMRGQLAEGNLTIVHAAASDPDWGAGGARGEPDGLAGFTEAYTENVGDTTGRLTNGYAMAHHDAVMTAVQAIRLYSREGGEGGDDPLRAEGARGALFRLNAGNVVRGATGDLSFSATRDGDPGGKPVPVFEIPGPGEAPAHDLYITPAE